MSLIFKVAKQFRCNVQNTINTVIPTKLSRSVHNKCFTIEKKCPTENQFRKGLVLGIYKDPEFPEDGGKLTEIAENFNKKVDGKLEHYLKIQGPAPDLGKVLYFYDLCPDIPVVAVVGLGKECSGYEIAEKMDIGKEHIRTAAAAATVGLQEKYVKRVYCESFGHAESAAEGAAMGSWIYQENRNRKDQLFIPKLELYESCDWSGWQIGLQKAAAQNMSRYLTELSSNYLTPSQFAQNCVDLLCNVGINVEVKVRAWAESMKMNGFLLASKGSCEPPVFLELSYYGADRDERPIVMIGKGLTFNSGGINLKNSKAQKLMRGDMAGAAIAVSTIRAVSMLELPINLRCLIPLCENMPGCSAMRPGDIITTMDGKKVKIDSTGNAGRLIMLDALAYAQTFWPRFIIDVGTISSDMRQLMGRGATGVWSNSETLWKFLQAAAMHTGDRVWRFPLWNHFQSLLSSSQDVDLHTTGNGFGEPCKAASLLYEFVPCGDWIHMDNYGVLTANGIDETYLRKGMAGRPARTVVEFLSMLVCQKDSEEAGECESSDGKVQ